MKIQNAILLILISFALSSFSNCGPRTQVDFKVENKSGQALTVKFIGHSFGEHSTTNVIGTETKLTFFLIDGNGSQNTKEFLEDIESMPFDSLQIVSEDGRFYRNDELDADNWEKVFPKKKEGLGSMILKVSETDLE